MSFKELLFAAQCLSAMRWGNTSGQTQNGCAHLGIWNILVMVQEGGFLKVKAAGILTAWK